MLTQLLQSSQKSSPPLHVSPFNIRHVYSTSSSSSHHSLYMVSSAQRNLSSSSSSSQNHLYIIEALEIIMSALRAPSIHLIKKFSEVCVFWKSGSLYVAILATLIGIVITRVLLRILNHHRRRRDRSEGTSLAVGRSSFDDDFSDLDDDDVSVSSMEDEEGETECRESDEEVKSKLHRMFSWSDFAKGKSVVKLWDGIGLGLDLNHSSGSLISIYDLDREQRITSIFDKCKLPTILRTSPMPSSVVISASRTSFSTWDSRDNRMGPSIVAEWDEVGLGSSLGNGNRTPPGLVFRGVTKVFNGEKASGMVTVADARKAGSPMAAATLWESYQ